MDDLLEEFDQVSQDWDHSCTQTISDLHAILDELQQHRKRSIDGAMISKKSTGTLAAWKSLHVQVSKFAKNFEKKLKHDSPIVGDIETTDQARSKRIDELLKTCLLHNFYRKGNFEAAARLEEESTINVDAGLQQTYAELGELLDSLKDGDIKPSLQWIEKNGASLGEGGSVKLRFELHRLQFMRLIREEPIKAFLFAQTNFKSFLHSHPDEVQTLMGCLAYAYRLDDSPYATYLARDFLGMTSSSLSAAFAKAKKLPQENAFYDCIRLGSAALPKINKVEIDLDASQRYHSVFVCPVLKQQTTGENPPMMLPCGHVICLEALNRLGKGNNFVRFKCPYCPVESSLSQATKVYF